MKTPNRLHQIRNFGSVKKIFFVFSLLAFTLTYGQGRIVEDSLHKYFTENKDKLDPLEGFWEVSSNLEYYHHDTLFDVERTRIPARVAITKKDKFFSIINLSDEEQAAIFESTEVPGVYLHKAFFSKTNEHSASQVVIISKNELSFSYDYPEGYTRMVLGSNFKDGLKVVNHLTWSKILLEK